MLHAAMFDERRTNLKAATHNRLQFTAVSSKSEKLAANESHTIYCEGHKCRELYFTCSSQGVFCRDTYLWLDCAAHLIVDGDAIEMLRKCYAQRNLNDA